MSTPSATATTHAARDHARAQAGARAATQPTVPARLAADPPAGVDPADLLWEETLGPGGYATHRLPRGARLRLADVEGDACVSLVLHRGDAPQERLNVADTVKVQWQAYLGPGAVLLSDMGRVMASLVEDTSARHDALCGASTAAENAARYGRGEVWGPAPAARDRLLVALAKNDLGARDLPPALTLFKRVAVDADGALTLDGAPAPGTHVTLRAEMDLVVCLANCPHRLDDRAEYAATPVRLTAWAGDPAGPDDPVRRSSPERGRAYDNTDEAVAARGGAR
ncbi:MAG: DUF1989 domain-containing protein [Thermoleophilia bacterium]|nr:DUF1989 domain-containing protein [Thermoleophilia bacterium]